MVKYLDSNKANKANKANKEILQKIELLALEKGIAKDLVFEGLEKGLTAAYKKELGGEITGDVKVLVDRVTGCFSPVITLFVVKDPKDVVSEYVQIDLPKLKSLGIDARDGDYVDIHLESVDFSRVSAQIVRGVVSQSIYNAEKQQIINDFIMRNGNIVSGKLIRYERVGAILECGKLEVVIPRSDLLAKSQFKIGEIVKGYLDKDNPNIQNGRLFLSRKSELFIMALFEQNVPEIANQQTKIIAIAREFGVRSKVAVVALDEKIDAKGSLLGFRGQRVDNVLRNLQGEKIDVILCPYTEDGLVDKVQFVINALSPADGFNINYFEDSGMFEVIAPDDKIGSILGAGGVNTNLVVELLNKLDSLDAQKYSIKVFSANDAKEHENTRNDKIMQELIDDLEIDTDIAKILVLEHDFTSVEEVAYVEQQELLNIPEFDSDIVEILQERAKNILLLKSLNIQNKMADFVKQVSPIIKLSHSDLQKMVEKGIEALADIAELDSVELMEIIPADEQKINDLIIYARKKCGYFD